MVQSDQDEKFAGTYRKLFDTIERGVEQCSTDRLQTLLEEKKEQLKLGLEAFAEPSSQSHTKLTSAGSNGVTINGKSIKLSQSEKDFVLKLSEILSLNELNCAQLWEAYRQENKDQQQPTENFVENLDLVMKVISFYYEDRTSFLQCISSLQRLSLDDKHPYASIAKDTVTKVFGEDFTGRLFSQFAKLVRSAIPKNTLSFPGWALVWAKQNLKEQKAILEIIFLSSLTEEFKATFTLSIIQEFEANCFGTLQVFGYVLDEEGSKLRESVTSIATVLAVNLIVPPTVTKSAKLSPTSSTLFNTPDAIVKINQIALHLGDREEYAPLLMAWSYFLASLSVALDIGGNTPIPPNYKPVELLLKGEATGLLSVLIDRPQVSGSEFTQHRRITIKQGPNMNGIYAGRSIKLNVFNVCTDILQNEICSDEDVNNFGYRSVLRSLFKGFLSVANPHFVPLDSYASLINCYCLIYKNQEQLGEAFWNDDFDKEDPNTLLATARNRFPVYFTDFTRILSALCGDSAANGGKGNCAEQVFNYLCLVPTLTTDLNTQVRKSAEEVGEATIIQADQTIRVTQEIQSIASIEIPEGSRGVMLYGGEGEVVVQFSVAHSGWHLLTAVLASFMNNAGSGIDVTDENGSLRGQNIEAIDSILDLIHNVMSNNSELITNFVQHIESVSRIPGQTTGTPIIISALCGILSSCSAVHPCPISTMTLALKCLTLLIPYYRNDIWAYFQSAPFLPRPTASISVSAKLTNPFSGNPAAQIQQIVARVECVTGKYTLLLAFLDMVQGLVHDVQRSWWANGSSDTVVPSNQHKVEILYLCLHYLMLDVFPSYADWRYKSLSERYLIGSKVLDIFIEIARGFKSNTSSQGDNLTLNSIREGIFSNFLYEGGVYHISPLLDIVSEGCNKANVLYKLNHPKEAQRVEQLTEKTFVFIKILLQHRLEQINAGSKHSESALERLLLERPTGVNCSDFLFRIARHINYRHNIALQIQATDVLYLLCRTISSWKTVPNFVQYLGSTDQVHQIIRTYLEIAKDPYQNEVLLSSIWRLMTSFLETQPSLAILFLDCGDFIMPSPKSAVRLLAGQQAAAPSVAASAPAVSESAIRAAVDILGEWETLFMQKPTVMSNVVRFLSTFWQTAFDHYALVERTRSDNALWDGLGKILLNPSTDTDVSGSHLQLLDLMAPKASTNNSSRKDLSVRRLCCLNLSKAHVMRIISFEIHLTAGNERARGNTSANVLDKLPAGLKNLVNKISESTKLTQMRQTFVKNDFNSSIAQKATRDAQILLESIGNYNDASTLLYKMDRIGGHGDDDAAGEPRQYGDSYLYDYQLAEQRVRNLFKDIIGKYGLTSLENVIVTPEIQSALDIKRYANNLLMSVLQVNYNSSIVDSQIILLRSFKTFIEVSSNRVSDLIWANKSSAQGSASLYSFLMGLIEDAQEEKRSDGVSLTSYDILIQFIRGLTEDWINKNASVLTGIDANHKKDYASKTFNLLSALCGLLDRENFAVMNSINDFTAVRFHRPLLESVLLSLRTLGGIARNLASTQAEFQQCLKALLAVVCQSFHVLVIKAGSYSAAGSLVSEECQESCIKDVTVVVSLLQDLISPKYDVPESVWVENFTTYSTIPSLLNLFHGGVELAVKEIDSQVSSASNVYSLSVTPYAESALYLLLELSNIPRGADELVRRHIFASFTNNCLTQRLQQGSLELFIKFGDGSKEGPAYVERNPLHVVWCQMLGVVSNLNRHLGISEGVFDKTTNFMQIYGPQIGRAYANANGANDAIFGLAPSKSLSTALLEEIDRINMVFFGLASHFHKNRASNPNIDNLFMSFKDCSLYLLQRYLYFFTHPSHMQAQLYPVDNIERQQAQTTPKETSDKESSLPSSSQFMQRILKQTLAICHSMVTTLIILSEADVVLTDDITKWPFGNTIIHPDVRVIAKETATFGTLIECINIAVAMLTQQDKNTICKELLDLISDCSLLLTAQTALWITKPDINDDTRLEIAQESLTDIVESVSKVETALKKLDLPSHKIESRIKLIQTLQVFLCNRFYTK